VGFNVLHDVVKVTLYSFDVDEIMDVGLWNRFGGAQPSPNIGGSIVANDHLRWNVFHNLTKEHAIEAHMWRPLILSPFCNGANSLCIQ
jgi:hypothetical protein